MANLIGLIANAAGTGLTGTLTATLTSNVIIDVTPFSILTTRGAVFAITDGDVDITLPESATDGVPYRFVFTPSTPSDSDPLLDFLAIVPNVGTVELALLVPTGITQSSLDTGALRVAAVLASNAQTAQVLKQSILHGAELVGITATTTFYVGKPFDGTVFVRRAQLFALSGFADWTLVAGYVDSAGVDQTITVESTTTDTQSGRRLVTNLYALTVPNTAMALWVRLVAGAGALALTGKVSLAFIEN